MRWWVVFHPTAVSRCVPEEVRGGGVPGSLRQPGWLCRWDRWCYPVGWRTVMITTCSAFRSETQTKSPAQHPQTPPVSSDTQVEVTNIRPQGAIESQSEGSKRTRRVTSNVDGCSYWTERRDEYMKRWRDSSSRSQRLTICRWNYNTWNESCRLKCFNLICHPAWKQATPTEPDAPASQQDAHYL